MLYFSRAAYKDMTALYVVASTVPAGRTVEAEIGNLAAQNQKNVEARSISIRPDGLLTSLSVHRLFVHGKDRIEVVGLRYFKEPLGPDFETEAVSVLSSFVEDAADSLQSCTLNLPPREQ